MTRIGIVEDNKVIRESLAAYVHTDPEFRCVCAFASAQEALRDMPRHQPEIVLMDIQLPGISGIECTAKLTQTLPLVRVIMVTVYGDLDLIFRALRAGASGYLLERCTPGELVSAIRELQEGGAPMSREIARKVIGFFKDQAAPADIAPEMRELSPREREILELLAQGFLNKEIADRLGVRHGTVRWHLQHVSNKLHVRTRMEAVLKFQSAKPVY